MGVVPTDAIITELAELHFGFCPHPDHRGRLYAFHDRNGVFLSKHGGGTHPCQITRPRRLHTAVELTTGPPTAAAAAPPGG